MTVSHIDEKVKNMLDNRCYNVSTIAKLLGKGWTDQKAANVVLNLARKGLIDKVKAALILKDMPCAKFLSIAHNSKNTGK